MTDQERAAKFDHYVEILHNGLLAATDETQRRELVRVLVNVLTQRKRLREAGGEICLTLNVCDLTILQELEGKGE